MSNLRVVAFLRALATAVEVERADDAEQGESAGAEAGRAQLAESGLGSVGCGEQFSLETRQAQRGVGRLDP